MRKKVTVVGSGNVGATAAHWIASKELADVVLIDIIEGVPQGKGLDLLEAMPIEKRDSYVIGTNDYADTANSEIVVITAGIPRKPGMSRDDLLNTNYGIMKAVVGEVVKYSPNCILIVVSNPLDAMAQAAYKLSGFPRERVVGMAGVLDSARFRAFIADELKVSVENVTAFVLGGHGDTMVPLPRYSTVAGIPITELIEKSRLEALVQRTRDGGAEIVKHLKTGSAYSAPSAAATGMAGAIPTDNKKIIPSARYLQGEYGVNGFSCLYHRSDEDGRNLISRRTLIFVECDNQKTIVCLRPCHITLQMRLEPTIALLNCAIVHVIEQIGDDPGDRGQIGIVGGETTERHAVA